MALGNRGMGLEGLINATNDAYLARGMAVVHKRPTPVKIMGTQGTRITKAVLEAKSTVDYEGVYRAHSLQFEAKQTRHDSRFDFDNVHDHQIGHLRACSAQGAICFILVEFTKRHEVFYVPAKMLIDAWDEGMRGGRKSLAYDDVSVMCHQVRPSRGVALDYLAVVDKLMEPKAVS